jgi:protocatechuate 3,4-dioxygenase beta subunit
LRLLRVEELERREMMAADIQLGAVYFDPASGTDSIPNTFTVNWQGGAPGTQLSQLTINLDKNGNGTIDDGECFFNTAAGGLGVYGYTPFTLQSISAGASITSAQVANSGQQLVLNFSGFTSGDKLVFQIDVDEMGHDGSGNPYVSAVAEGAEFAGSLLLGTFVNPDYQNASGQGTFVDAFNSELAASGLSLPPDNYVPPSVIDETVLTAGTMFPLTQLPLPSSISGHVQLATNGLCDDPGATVTPLAGVTLMLLDQNGNAVLDSNGHAITTTTDASGNYSFNNLLPGTYSVKEVQPTGYLEGDSDVGTISGVTTGTSVNPDLLSNITLVANNQGINYDFCEQLPVSISGQVNIALHGTCDDPGATLLPAAGVTVLLLDANGVQVLDANGHAVSTVTAADGTYSFTNLAPGTYGVRDIIPVGYLAGDADLGTVNGAANGTVVSDTSTQGVVLKSGNHGIDYDFCLQVPVSIGGRVVVATNGTCDDPGATLTPLAGVTVLLLDAHGIQVLDAHGNPVSTVTAADGTYSFTNLAPGTYGVRDIIPAGYFAGDADLGTVNGLPNGTVIGNDRTVTVVLASGEQGVDYDFCLQVPVSISGQVNIATNGDCDDPGATLRPLPGVTVVLLDSTGATVLDTHGNAVTTVTGADGRYSFTNLPAGTYGVHEILPAGYMAGDSDVGTVNGVLNGSSTDTQTLTTIVLLSGNEGIDYDFCVNPPSVISGYVFQDGPNISIPFNEPVSDVLNTLPTIRDGQRTPDDTMLAGQVLVLADGSGNPLHDAQGNLITAVTDASGFYQFTGVLPGTYSVIFALVPSGYYRGLNTPGSTGGLTLYPGDMISSFTVVAGFDSTENDFSVVRIDQLPLIIPPPTNPPPALAPLTSAVIPPPPIAPPQQPLAPAPPPSRFIGSSPAISFTWHLSVVNAGRPRNNRGPVDSVVQIAARPSDAVGWGMDHLDDSHWSLNTKDGEHPEIDFGMRNGIPVTGDFNGDGNTDVGIYYKGQWFIDLNGNGVWDKEDLWAKLGYDEDLPITGDWDGDGKIDIGIYGRAWPGDPKAVAEEPGLPNPDNVNTGVRKNAPLERKLAVVGSRVMQRTSAGKPREDVIDHVFFYGKPGDYPIAGNWNGSGIDTIGVFRDGIWKLDMNGDGKWSDTDMTVEMGQQGDLPVVGDFNGDGVDELGVYRNGTWYIDTNNDHVLDDRDMIIKFGNPGDTPVVGDWNGDGSDEVGTYHNGAIKPKT